MRMCCAIIEGITERAYVHLIFINEKWPAGQLPTSHSRPTAASSHSTYADDRSFLYTSTELATFFTPLMKLFKISIASSSPYSEIINSIKLGSGSSKDAQFSAGNAPVISHSPSPRVERDCATVLVPRSYQERCREIGLEKRIDRITSWFSSSSIGLHCLIRWVGIPRALCLKICLGGRLNRPSRINVRIGWATLKYGDQTLESAETAEDLRAMKSSRRKAAMQSHAKRSPTSL